MGLPKTGFTQQAYSLHLMYERPGLSSASAGIGAMGGFGQSGYGFDGGFMENLVGRRSGVCGGSLWSAAVVRPLPSPYGDWGSGGPVTYAATFLTDTGKAWGVGDADSGATVTYGANTVTDTARNNAQAWVVGNTAQYAGAIILTATGKSGIVASAAAGVLTLVANWTGGTPAAGEAYTINGGGQVGRQILSIGTGNNKTVGTVLYHTGTIATIAAWSNGTPGAGAVYQLGPASVGPHAEGNRFVVNLPEASDNFYKAQIELGNTEAT